MKRFFTFFFLLTGSSYTDAQNVSLDKTYGQGGIVLTPPDNFPRGLGEYLASAIQPDDKVITAGDFGDSVGNDFKVWSTLQRYNTDGSLDKTFGEGGRVLTSFDSPYTEGTDWRLLAVQPDGRIVAATNLYKHDSRFNEYGFVSGDIVLERYKPNGTVDSSFGVNGIVITDLGLDETVNAMTLQKDGKIVLTGIQISNYGNNGPLLVLRYNPEGTAVALQPDGKIVSGGDFNYGPGQLCVYRYLPDGTLDKAFGINGRVTTQFTETLFLHIGSLAVLSDGSILAGGSGSDVIEKSNMVVVRYTPGGVIDKSFGKEGKAFVSFGLDTSSNVVRLFVKPDGEILLAGTSGGAESANGVDVNFALAQLLPNGTPDISFGTNGKVSTDLNNGFTDDAKSAEMQKDGNVVIVGNSYTYRPQTIYYNALARYNTGSKAERPVVIKVKRFLHSHGITWQSTGSGASYYRIEESSNSAAGFREVGRVPGSSNENYTYTIPVAAVGNAVPATDYYRVTAVSATGRSAVSNVIALSNAPVISLYPNPVVGKLTLTNLDATTDSKISVADASGTVWLTAVAKQQPQATCDVSRLRPGAYLVSISSRAQTISLAFVKQ